MSSAIISVISIFIAAFSLYISWQKNVRDRDCANDKELLEQLKQSLELAYFSIAPDNEGPPVNNRLRWLSSARHIIRYRQLKESLSTTLYKTLCEEQEAYWSDRFFILLRKIEGSKYYVMINSEEMVDEHIEPRSAAIVHSFSVWKKDRHDPLDETRFEDIVRSYKLFSPLNRHFEEYIKRKHPNLAKKVEGEGSQ